MGQPEDFRVLRTTNLTVSKIYEVFVEEPKCSVDRINSRWALIQHSIRAFGLMKVSAHFFV